MLAVAATVAVTAVVAVGAVVLLGGHSRTTTSASRPTPGRQRLIDILGVLRRPQTKADLAVPFLANLRRAGSQARPLLGLVDRPLVRLATVTAGGLKIYLIPFKPPTKAQLAAAPQLLRYLRIANAHDETLSILGGVEGFGATAAQIERIGAYGGFGLTSENGSGSGSSVHEAWTDTDEWAGVVPDGVARVVVHIPGRPGHPQPETLTSVVHDNVFAVRSSAHGTGKAPQVLLHLDLHLVRRKRPRAQARGRAPHQALTGRLLY